MSLANPLLRTLSALDLSIRVHTRTLDELLKLPELVTNVLVDEELDEFDMQVRKYIIANDLPPYNSKTCQIDEWWGKIDDKNELLIFKKMVCALLSCFHDHAIESSFSVMGDIMDVKSAIITVQTYASY